MLFRKRKFGVFQTREGVILTKDQLSEIEKNLAEFEKGRGSQNIILGNLLEFIPYNYPKRNGKRYKRRLPNKRVK